VDREGEFLGTIIGVAVGAVIGGTIAAVKGDNVWEGIGKGAVAGGVAGAVLDITVATAGTGTVALVTAGALSGAAGNATQQGLDIATGDRSDFSFTELGVSTVLGAGLSYLGSKIAGPVSRGLNRLFKGKPNTVRTGTGSGGPLRIVNSVQTAEEANAAAAAQGAKPPYAPGTSVSTQTTTQAEGGFVRVYTEGVTNPEGAWIMEASEIQGLTPAQIQDKFALPNLPNKVVDVVVPKGAKIETSTAGFVEGWGQGGGAQVKLLDRGATFSNPRPLPTE
jgi:hypothetical protein